MRRGLALVLSSLVVILVLAAGGMLLEPAGSGRSFERPGPVAASSAVPGPVLYSALAARMVAQRTATYTFSGSSGGGEPQSGAGALRLHSATGPDSSFEAEVTLTSADTGRVKAVLGPKEFYLALPPAQGLPRDKPWLKVPADPTNALGRELQPMVQHTRAAFDPSQSLGLLRIAPSVTEVGRDTVDGVTTTEHRAMVDLRQVESMTTDPGLREQYQAMLDAGVRTLEVRVWLDDEGLPRRFSAAVPGTTAVFSMTGIFDRWGKAVTINVPRARNVLDAEALAKASKRPGRKVLRPPALPR